MTCASELPDYLLGGFEQKYHIAKADGTPVKDEARYFVLRYDKDPNAVVAMSAYAKNMIGKNSRFASDLFRVLFIHAQEHNLIDQWAEACHSLLYRGKFPQEARLQANMADKLTERLSDESEEPNETVTKT